MSKLEADLARQLAKLVKETAPKPREIGVEIVVSSDDDSAAGDCVEAMRESYAIVKQAFQDCFNTLQVVRSKYETECTQADLADISFIAREIMILLKDLTTEHNKTKDAIAKIMCAASGGFSVQTGHPPGVVGRFCNAYCRDKMRVRVPKFEHEPEVYQAMMRYFGIPEDLWDRGKELWAEGEFRTKVFEADYLGLQDWIDRITAMGHAVPDCFPPEYRFTEATVTCKKTRDIL